ncbi:MAG TPA: translation initiation factor IF-2 N-terminal domain-containing protein, partial [Pseudonocardia sp.]|nr:translation initiation factor IF-2 N-terminal domain-containing protein [Pseudonocardia sp.]
MDDLPEKMRVHALARLLGRTSREVISTLAELGVVARTAQSSIDRKAAEQVVAAFVPAVEGEPPPEPAEVDAGRSAGAIGEPASAEELAGPLAPLFAPPAPLFQPPAPPEPAVRGRRRRVADEEPADSAAETETPEVLTGPAEAEDADDEGSARRRRRRGRRGRGRGRG